MLAVQLPQSFGLLLFLPFLASGLYAFYCFDSLVRYQYRHHFKEWEKDGRPIGFFWGPTDASMLQGSLARNYAHFALLFCRKAWIESDEEAKRLRRRYQIAALANFICFGLVFWLLNSSMHNAQ